MNVIGTGLSGLVGSRIVELLSPSVQFAPLSSKGLVDITDHAAVFEAVTKSSAPWILHLAAYTDVQGAEKEKEKGKESKAWQINVEATKNLVNIAHTTGKHLLYIDTDYAFDGTKESYTEEDVPNPQGFYAVTKTEGAKHVLSLDTHGLVMRIANPYRSEVSVVDLKEPHAGKKDFVHKMIERLRSGLDIKAPTDQLFVPTFVDDIAHAMDVLMQKKAYGVYHVVGSEAISPYDVAKEIASVYGLDDSHITETSFASYFEGSAPIPQYAALSNKKIESLGITMKTFSEGIREVKKQEDTKDL
jgi:dTDP-4-dehydrorhamnose reductase